MEGQKRTHTVVMLSLGLASQQVFLDLCPLHASSSGFVSLPLFFSHLSIASFLFIYLFLYSFIYLFLPSPILNLCFNFSSVLPLLSLHFSCYLFSPSVCSVSGHCSCPGCACLVFHPLPQTGPRTVSYINLKVFRSLATSEGPENRCAQCYIYTPRCSNAPSCCS